MKPQLTTCGSIAALLLAMQAPAVAEQQQERPLATDIETPDPLLIDTDPDKRNRQYGEKDIYISGEGDRQNQLVKPDPLEKALDEKKEGGAPSGDIKVMPRETTEEDKAIETPDRLLKTIRDGANGNTGNNDGGNHGDLVTPDPLLDSVN